MAKNENDFVDLVNLNVNHEIEVRKESKVIFIVAHTNIVLLLTI